MKLNNRIAGTMGSYLYNVDAGWDAVLGGIAGAGFKYVDLSAPHQWKEHIDVEGSSPQDIERLRGILSKYHLTPISMAAHCELINKEGVEAFKRRVEFAKLFGIRILVTGTGKWYDGRDLDQLYGNLREVAGYAQEQGVLVALETHGRNEVSLGKQYLPIIKHIDSPSVRVCYDTANVIYYENVRPENDLPYIAEYLGYVHLKDKRYGQGVWDFPALGEGEVRFERIFKILSDVGYSGPMSAEIQLTPPPSPRYGVDIAEVNAAQARSLKFLQGYFSSL